MYAITLTAPALLAPRTTLAVDGARLLLDVDIGVAGSAAESHLPG